MLIVELHAVIVALGDERDQLRYVPLNPCRRGEHDPQGCRVVVVHQRNQLDAMRARGGNDVGIVGNPERLRRPGRVEGEPLGMNGVVESGWAANVAAPSLGVSEPIQPQCVRLLCAARPPAAPPDG